MRAAVIGLGVEGKKAFNSLINHGWDVYASDLNVNVDLSGLDIPKLDMELIKRGDSFSFISSNFVLDIGFTNPDEIDDCDAIAISPSMWGGSFASKIVENGKLLCDVLTKHRDLFTIGITGTNGKTTTVHMLKEILENDGKKVLVGGNGGGGFEGYYDLILEANENDYDVLLVEVCDMTLDFANYCFDFDIVGLTNMGNDHMDVHKTVANYKNSLVRFFKDKNIVIAYNQDFKADFIDSALNSIPYFESQEELQVFGEFNRCNAGLATAIATELKIKKDIIKESLNNFKAVAGRLDVYPLNDSLIYIGKTDNSDALASVLAENNFYAIFIGTPRPHEKHRLDILDEVVKYNPEVIVLFPGLDDNFEVAKYRLNSLNYEGRVEIATSLDEIVALVAEFSHEEAMLIGGNGQDVIIDIQERIRLLSQNCN
ncbi:Mur ligase family protein [Methanobrevibacter woesei]|uniref:Mur ligase family protein n=1 Tax=Methanobrevibacter woesei TaxID=190976 RepID=UPI00255BE0C0|nr:Mur ligase family protein [Methanobrevibacter woesei]